LRHGHSSAIIIPAKFLKSLGINRGDPVSLRFDYNRGQVVLFFPQSRQLRFEVGGKKR